MLQVPGADGEGFGTATGGDPPGRRVPEHRGRGLKKVCGAWKWQAEDEEQQSLLETGGRNRDASLEATEGEGL